MADGSLLALEGIDGAGTSTQVEALAARLGQRGYQVTTAHEPSRGPIGQFVRRQLGPNVGAEGGLSEPPLALLFAADRLDHVARTLAPALARGDIVLCDRYLWSSYAYQGAVLDPAWIQAINALAPAPACTIYLWVPQEVARARRGARGSPEERFDDDARQRSVAARYDALAAASPGGACLRIDGSPPAAAVTDHILAALAPYLPPLAAPSPGAAWPQATR